MPFILVSVRIPPQIDSVTLQPLGYASSLETGPTRVGDRHSSTDLMRYLRASLKDNFYNTLDPPRIVLDKLESRGYKLISTCATENIFMWTLHR